MWTDAPILSAQENSGLKSLSTEGIRLKVAKLRTTCMLEVKIQRFMPYVLF